MRNGCCVVWLLYSMVGALLCAAEHSGLVHMASWHLVRLGGEWPRHGAPATVVTAVLLLHA